MNLTMYDKLMSLPLFNGLTRTQLSDFLAKTNVNFVNYKRGETIVREGERVDSLRYLISGRAKSRFECESVQLSVSQTVLPGYVFAPERLFGLLHTYPATVVATEASSILQFRKDEYLRALHSNDIFLVNILNYLSFRTQRPVASIKKMGAGTLDSFIGYLLFILTDRQSEGIEIRSTRETLHSLTNISYSQIDISLQRMRSAGLIDYARNIIYVRSRGEFVDIVLNADPRILYSDTE